jgi:thiol:disulfide interchange protein
MKRALLVVLGIGLGALLAGLAQAQDGQGGAPLPQQLRGDEFSDSQYAVARFTYADRTQLHPGDDFTLAVQLVPFHREELKFHIYSNVPSADGAYVETTLAMVDAAHPQPLRAVDGAPPAPAGDNGEVAWEAPVFPKDTEHHGQLWLEGQPVITIRGKLKPDAAPGKKAFHAVTTFMSCTEDFCLSPSEVVLDWELEVVPAGTATGTVLTAAELAAPRPFDESMFHLPPANPPSASGTLAGGEPAGTAAGGLPKELRGDEFAESQYAVARQLYADRSKLHPGDDFTLAVQFLPFHRGDGLSFHIYSDVPSADGMYTPTKLEIVNADAPQPLLAQDNAPAPSGDNRDVTWSKPVFPAGESHAGQLWLTGQPVVTVHGKLSPTAAAGPKTFYAIATFTSCTTDFCLSPSEVVLKWELEVVAPSAAVGTILTEAQLQAPQPYSEALFSLPGQTPAAPMNLAPSPPAVAGTAGPIDWGKIQTKPGGMGQIPLWRLLLLSFIGGLILNFMPCVLPVVSIKVISLVRQVEDHPKTVLAHGVAFALGIMFMFLVAAIVIALIQAGGTKLGWGSQFQSPEFNVVMVALIFAFALSLAGVYTIKPPQAVTAAGEHLAEREGLSGSFFKGALATVLGTPCVGPFLGPALGVAFQRSWFDTIWIFFVVGLGMAVPYLAMLPFVMHMGRRERGTLSRKLQESKHWLVDFERVMAFLMFGTVVYLLNILFGVVGGQAIIWTLAFLVVIGFAAWLWGRLISDGPRRLPLALSSVIVIIGLGAWLTLSHVPAFAMYFGIQTPEVVAVGDTGMSAGRGGGGAAASAPGSQPNLSAKHPGWEEFDIPRLEYLVGHGTTVLVDFTADWCPNCKTNEAVALNIDSTRQLRDQLGIVFMVADWTKKDKQITSTLASLGYSSIPLSVIFPASNPNAPILLDGVFGPAELQEKMKQSVNKLTASAGAVTP